ncbi:hypothetical protein PPL_09357 [Heterostelium album PN500]|uniref:B box-type domain-containing protein n=1 Tax=Heterostelium pallidum (strain ATCC 26659 / Pp 5 / PN500) TaxID=670386 RepID=D3BLC4_HETP5|nr:hypothetical protein PPL_09357 [Heterostelium album PN500]EFA77858.1 hypothetical protein PPL_09357 [Heterostelium album PN500]|eukprot:XP_020429986.1 hypothetical protein PPL_09357 [Heterostelium album PN500]
MNSCSNHNNRIFEFICYDCNVLMCSACVPQHRLHLFDHIDGIKSEINNHINNNNNDSNSNNNINNNSNIPSFLDIQSKIKITFDSLKSAVKEYQQLQQTEDEISSRFKELHEFLVVEEHKLKKPIIDNKQQLEQHVESQITVMKSLNLMNHQLNQFIADSNTDNIQPTTTTATTTTSSSSAATDTTDSYQTSTIITSISQCSDHKEFIQNNNNTLFSFNDHLHNHYSNKTKKDDHSLLNLILEHNNTLKSNNHIDVKHNKLQQYQLIIKDQQLHQIKNQLQSTFKLVIQQHQPRQQLQDSYILSTDVDGKISVIDITDQNNIYFVQQGYATIDAKLGFYSSVVVGNHFYRFGDEAKARKYFRFSIHNQIYNEIEMNGIEECGYVSVCYDGKDHIYLLDGCMKPKLHIYRFNINNLTFEEYSTAENTNPHYHHLTFHRNNCIYSYIPEANKIIKFDISTKVTVELPIELPNKQQKAACTDGNGSLFVLTNTGFHQINIETHEFKQLDKSIANMNINNHNLIYHQANDQKRYIYSLQGKSHNYRYSFEHNQWKSILENDQANRLYCGHHLFHK